MSILNTPLAYLEVNMEQKEQKEFIEPSLTVILQPGEEKRIIPRHKAKNVRRLIEFLGLRPYTAMVIRNNIPLTPDVPLYPEQTIIVRKVMSAG